ncbi:protein of unknown function [Geodermatophilus telluris]|uniref:DUF222 domain-containing protein n=1 Tax=Geodermatophilus telluris TaxID=1190417 RepID=A0A1G6LTA7_9ACTN|nr:protein of unknown function [Geodermatophilus telluris]
MQAADREIARQTALRARAVAEFAASRPASADRPPGAPGAMAAERWAGRAGVLRPVSEWAAQELAVALALSEPAAEALLERSLTLVHRLPAVLAALEAGVLHPGHLWPLLEHLAPVADDALRAALEGELLAWVAGRAVSTPAQLGAKARRLVLARDARAAADRLVRAVRRRGIEVRPDRVAGMSVVTALLSTPEARALLAALGAYADALPTDPADGRSRGQRMADCLLDLVLRPGESGRAPVQVTLTVVAPVGALLGGDAACEIDGQVVPAEVVRALLAALAGIPVAVAEPDAGAAAPDATGTDLHSEPDTDRHTDTETDAETDAETEPHTGGRVDRGATAHLAAQLGWQAREQQELERWWAECERRVLTGEHEPGPDPVPGEELLRWLTEHGPPPKSGEDLGEGPAPDLDAPPSAAPPSDPGEGWWARADRAVDDASAALLAAQQAIGHARRLVATADHADTTDETTRAHGPAGRAGVARDALTALHAATDEHRDALAALLQRTAGGGLADRPRLALTDALTGALLALTDLPALRRADRAGTGLHRPPATDGYRPAAALDRYVRARDRRCRFPGCRHRVPPGGELDHTRPWPDGETSAANLAGFCTRHHRGKHQAPGWHHDLAPDGTLTVTTPTGLTATTTPPPY